MPPVNQITPSGAWWALSGILSIIADIKEHECWFLPSSLFQVDVQYQRMMKRFLPLSELKKYHLQHRDKGGPLKDMALFTRARLSVQPLTTGKSNMSFSHDDCVTVAYPTM